MQTRWGHLRITGWHPKSRDIWRMQCDCGYKFEYKSINFPGRNVMRACGLADCPYSYPQGKKRMGRPVTENPGSAVTLWLPYRTQKMLDTYAKKHKMPKGRAAADLIDQGLLK